MAIQLPPRNNVSSTGFLDRIVAGFTRRPRTVNPTSTRGGAGYTVYSGYITERERNFELTDVERYRTYGRILADVPMVAAGVRYFLNLAAKTEWKLIPADESEEAQEKARFVEKMFRNMDTPFHKMVRHAAMHRFYGFTVMEWTAKREDDGSIIVSHIESRPQWTIERWDTDFSGRIHGVIQRPPQTHEWIYLPRTKILYLADNSFTDDPRGLGILRHIVRSVKVLRDYEHLEQIGFETDMRGIPIARGPLAEIDAAVARGDLTKDDADALKKPLTDFITNHIRGTDSGLVLDSSVYQGTGEDETPINAPKFAVELLSGGSYGHKEIAAAVERINREIARVLGVEQLLLGADSAGSLALSRDKSQAFFMVVNSALAELQSALTQDIMKPIWILNGFDEELMPTFEFESVEFKDPEQISGAIKDLATSGVPILPEDELVDELLRVVGLSGLNRQAREDLDAKRLANARLGLDENGLPLPGGNPFQQTAPSGSNGSSSANKTPGQLSGNLEGVDPGGSADDALRGRQGRQAAARNTPRPENPA